MLRCFAWESMNSQGPVGLAPEIYYFLIQVSVFNDFTKYCRSCAFKPPQDQQTQVMQAYPISCEFIYDVNLRIAMEEKP